MLEERQIDKHVKSAHVNYVCHISVSNHSGRQMIDERQIDKHDSYKWQVTKHSG